jgi:DUF4097 and DUF4098 domain-containing protein YvlB
MRSQLLTLVIITVALVSLSAHAEDWSKQFTVSGKPTLRIETNDAEIRIVSWDRNEVGARVIVDGYKPDEVHVTDHQSGNQIELDIQLRRSAHFGWNVHSRSIRVEVSSPHAADLNLHSGDGDIRVNNVAGEFRLDTDDGNIEVRSAAGQLHADTHDGNIDACGRFSDLQVQTGDGNVDVEADSGSKISSNWSLRTGDGNLVLRIPPEFAAELDAHTGDGEITVDFPVTTMGSMKKENTVRGKMNGGGPILELRSGDGNIELAKM